jgi:two-component system CheB/CheR fusion protein
MSRREEESGALDCEQASTEAEVERGSAAAEGQAPISSIATGPSFIVGIGASAGGFEALSALIGRLGKPTRMAFVVVQHLLPTQASALPDLLWKATHVEVVTAEDGMRVLPNRVYVIPPNADLGIQQGVLQLRGPPSSGRRAHLPIDFFLRALAADAGKRAIGVVLSGTGSDGTFGLRAIKEAGGLTFVQDPESAKYDGMPRSALASGAVDHCLLPEAIAEELTLIEQRPHRILSNRPPPQREEHNNKLLGLIRAAFGTDLAYYKPATIDRRTERRLTLHKIDRLEDYVKFVQSDHDELRLLYKDFLIGVTSFFRDPEVFEALKTKVFPRIVENRRQPQTPIRIWVPACSTGEEAYSIAISLLEYLGEEPGRRVQIFGTDVDQDSIQRARRGLYPSNIELDISPERLGRYFVKRDGAYQISRRVRDMVVFSNQNVTSDAPFSKLDLVSCRNLLIYLQQSTQRKVLRTLHYALKPGAFLLLGTSETVGDSPELFSLVDRAAKLYISKHTSQTGFDPPLSREPQSRPNDSGFPERSAQSIAQIADRKILEMYGPPGVVINERMEILHFRGRTGPYLEPLPGAASLNILRLARPELHADLRRSIQNALEQNARVIKDCGVHASPGGRRLRLEIVPIADPEGQGRCLLVLFHEPPAEVQAPAPRLVEADGSEEQERIRELEHELLVTKEYLQSTVEELESVAEELRAANEELQSSNEELESANEELETSKDELQNANDELNAVNTELERRMLEQQQTLDDLHNVVAGVDSVVIVADLDLRIRRFTESAERLFRLEALDIGRSVGQLNEYLGGIRLEQLCADVMETLTPATREVQATDQRTYLLRVTPYRTIEHAIAGAVLVLSDADVKQRSTLVRQDGAEYASKFLEIVDHPLMVLDQGLSVHWVNRAFYEYFRAAPDETLALLLQKSGVGQWADRPLLDVIRTVLSNGGAFRDYAVEHALPEIGSRTINVSGSRIPGFGESSPLVLLSLEEDVT